MISSDSRTNKRAANLAYSQRLRPYFLTLARRLQSWSDAHDGFSIGVTSLKRREGKSTVALNLAAALAALQSENVLLVQSDFGNPTHSKRAGGKQQGLSELLSGSLTPSDCCLKTSIERLHLMGPGLLNGKDVLEKPLEAVRALNSELRTDFRAAVYDLPIVDELSLALLLAQQLDGLVLVMDSNHVDPKLIDRFRKRADDYNAEIIGLVLNKAMPARRT